MNVLKTFIWIQVIELLTKGLFYECQDITLEGYFRMKSNLSDYCTHTMSNLKENKIKNYV